MATAETDHRTTVRVAPFATGVVLSITAVVVLLHCGAAIFGDQYWFDEAYMLAIGRYHLDWGSADQPPLTPALAWLADTVAPGSVFVLRLPAILATAGTVVLAGLIARELGGGRGAQALTAFAQGTGVWLCFSGHWLTPYTLEPLQWLVVLWLLVRWIRARDDRLLLAIGVVVGVAAMTKFQVMALCAVILLAVAVFGPRELLRRPLLWLGAALAVLIALPTLIWQQLHGWPQLQMARIAAGEAEALYGGRPGVAVQLILCAGVAGAVFGGYGLWRLLRDEALRDYRFIGVVFVTLFVVFVASQGRIYYLVGLYAPLAAVGALGLQRSPARRPRLRRWLVGATCVCSAVVAAGALSVSVASTQDDTPQRIAARTAEIYRGLPAEQRERTAIFGKSYILAAFVDSYSERDGLPEAYSTNRSYGYFPPPPADRDSVLYIGPDPDELRPHFRSVEPLGEVVDETKAYLLTGRLQPWEELWPQLRTLTVS